jgi:CBS domain-containing protein
MAPVEEEVRDWMTPDPVTSPPTVSVSELARAMIDAHVHRVIIAEEDGRPIGIVSSTDILAAVAYAEKP